MKSKLSSLNSEHLIDEGVAASGDVEGAERRTWGTVSFSAERALLSQVLVDLAVESGLSVAVPAGLEEQRISVDFVEIDARDAFAAIASEIGRTVSLQDGVIRFRDKGVGAEGLRVLRAGYQSGKDVAGVVSQLIGGSAVVHMGDRVLVATDGSTGEVLDALERQLGRGGDGWQIDIRLVEVSRALSRDVGLDWDFGANVTATAATSPASVQGLQAAAIASVVAEATEDGRDAVLLQRARLYVLEGSSSRTLKGSRIPIPQRSVSSFGTVEVTGFDTVETGLSVQVSAERVPGGVRLELSPSLSAVTGFVEDAPIISTSEITASVVLRSGEWLVLLGLGTSETTEDATSIPFLGGGPLAGRSRERFSESSTLLLVRAVRVFAADATRLEVQLESDPFQGNAYMREVAERERAAREVEHVLDGD